MRACVLRAAILFVFAGSVVTAARAADGEASGNLGLVVTSDRAYGFSAAGGYWTSVTLDGPALSSRTSSYLGYVRTTRSIYAFNPATNRWYSSTYVGLPIGESVLGATIVFWTTHKAYAIATVWATWREQSFQGLSEPPRGGGSANSFGIVWTARAAYAFHAATGSWMRQNLESSPLGGLANNGLGLVWTNQQAFAFDATPGLWRSIDLADMQGVSSTGEGDVCLLWADKDAKVYSADQSAWFEFQTDQVIVGGSASGEVALLWTPDRAYAFSSSLALWGSVNLQGSFGFVEPGPESRTGAIRVSPNPTRGRTEVWLPGSEEAWKIGIYDAQGSLIARGEGAGGASYLWDGCSEDGRKVAAGAYWLRGESDGRVEIRKLVVLP